MHPKLELEQFLARRGDHLPSLDKNLMKIDNATPLMMLSFMPLCNLLDNVGNI